MPQIDLAIINLTIISVFTIFSVSFLCSLFYKPIQLNKSFFLFTNLSRNKFVTLPTQLLKKYLNK